MKALCFIFAICYIHDINNHFYIMAWEGKRIKMEYSPYNVYLVLNSDNEKQF